MIDLTQPAPGVLCAGSIVLDTIVRPFDHSHWGTTTFVESISRHVGGNGANTARALAILGNRVRLVGAVGNDEAASFVLQQIRADGVDTTAVSTVAQPNAATVVLVNSQGTRQFLHQLGASAEAFHEPLVFSAALLEGVQHFHLASLFVLPWLRRHAPEMLRRARAAGLSTSVDVNWDPHNEWLRVLEPCLPHIDFLFLNEDESRMLTGSDDPTLAAQHLQARGAHIILQKRSHEGCLIYSLGGAVPTRCHPFPVTAIDSTGAGDCFAAGFLSAHLRGASLQHAGDFANAAGARSVSAIGAVTGLLPASDLQRWMTDTQRTTT